MAKQSIRFAYYPGVYGDAFPHISAQIGGSWNAQGIFSYNWSFQILIKTLIFKFNYRIRSSPH